MRIVIASDLYLPVYNGVAQFSQNLAIALSRRGHDVLVIASSPTGKKYIEKENGYRVAWVTSLPFPLFPPHRFSINPTIEISKIMGDFRPDVVHVQSPLAIGLAARNAAKKFNVPVVATNHAMPENLIDNLKGLTHFAKQVTRLVKEYGHWFHSKNIAYITMPTQAALDMFDDLRKEINVPVKAVSNGIDLSRFTPGPKPTELMHRYGVPTDKPIVLYAGRLDGEKHLSILVKAVKRIHKKKDVYLVLSGTGNDEENLKRLVIDLDMQDYVSLLGRVSGEDLPNVYRMGAVFVMPSPAELQSIVTMEAEATGLPVVVVDAGAVHELCNDGGNGYICKTDNVIDMANKILKILNDKQLAKEMSKASLAVAKTHDIAQTAAEFEEIYKQVITAQKSQVVTARTKRPV